MKHLSKLLERLNDAEIAYKRADSSLDSSPLEVIVSRVDLKSARYAFDAACREYVLTYVLKVQEETEA